MLKHGNGKKIKSALDDDVFEIKEKSILFDEGGSNDELIKALDRAVEENIFTPDSVKKDGGKYPFFRQIVPS